MAKKSPKCVHGKLKHPRGNRVCKKARGRKSHKCPKGCR